MASAGPLVAANPFVWYCFTPLAINLVAGSAVLYIFWGLYFTNGDLQASDPNILERFFPLTHHYVDWMVDFYETIRRNVSFTEPTPEAIEYYRYFDTIIQSLTRIYPAYRHITPYWQYREDLISLEFRYTQTAQRLIRQFREMENMLMDHDVIDYRIPRFILEIIPQL